jgi:hypothetical protein
MKILLAVIGTALVVSTAPALAGTTVTVTVTGEVEFNGIRNSPIDRNNVPAGSDVVLTFQLDAGNFVDSGLFPVRGYVMEEPSFELTLNGVSVGLQNPYPAGQTPYFVIRNNDPAVDGFFLSSNVDSGAPEGVPTDEPGVFGQFYNNFYVTYGGSTLPSLDILDALGTYDFDGLTVFNWTLDDGAFGPNAMGLLFSQMTIVPEPASLVVLAAALICGLRRRG